MSPQLLLLIVSLVEEAFKHYPEISSDLKAIFSKENPTVEDWAALKAKVQGVSFESLAPDAPTVEVTVKVTEPPV